MYKINIFHPIRSLLLLTIIVSLVSCEKEQPPKFSGDNFLYFMNKLNESWNSSPKSINSPYTAETRINFLLSDNQLDTVFFNFNSEFPLFIQTDGKLLNSKRKISIELIGNGKKYVVLPHPDSLYIPANGTEIKLNMKLVRPLIPDTGLKQLTLILRNNENFNSEKHEWSRITYLFGNWIVAPTDYDLVESVYGDFSTAKMFAMRTAIDGAGADEWRLEPKLITLNNYLKARRQKEINFNPFTFDDLYNFLSLGTVVATYPDLIRDAYSVVAQKMKALTNVLIAERKLAGNPILDETGNEISFSQ